MTFVDVDQCRVESGVIYSAGVLTYLILGAIPSTLVAQDPVVEMLAQVVVRRPLSLWRILI